MKKTDDMESKINLKGIRWSWFFVMIALFLWGGYDYIKTQRVPLPSLLFILQFLVYFFVTSIEKWRLRKKK